MSRLEAFTDGVFAIAATLLILHVTADSPGESLGRALGHAWPQYGAYALAFLLIGIWWVNHHALMTAMCRVDRPFLLGHVAFLMCIAFIPFPTSLVAEHFHDRGLNAATFVFGLTMTAAATCMTFLWFYAAHGRRLIGERVDQRLLDRFSREVMWGMPSNAAVTLVALWYPYVALGIFSAIAVFFVFGGSLIERG